MLFIPYLYHIHKGEILYEVLNTLGDNKQIMGYPFNSTIRLCKSRNYYILVQKRTHGHNIKLLEEHKECFAF